MAKRKGKNGVEGIDLEHATEEQLRELVASVDSRAMLVVIARSGDHIAAFDAYYELVHGRVMPPHARKWIEGIYAARDRGKGVVIEAFRGSTKTTTVTITYTSYRIGKEPERANLLVQVGDDIAQDNTAQIADIIANNPAWKWVFPNIEPDRERGWGAGGYEVKRTDIGYDQWRQMNAQRKDPTLVGVGYRSREIIGKHPDGVLVVDDIHDENNTSSARELATVRKILTGTIFPTMTTDTWKVFIGTPWVDNDVLQYCISTGEFEHISTPVVDGEGALAWPNVFTEDAIEKQRRLAGSLEFARMFLLDLTAAKNRVFKYQEFPSSVIKAHWPMCGGVDYASNMDAYKNKAGKGDYFAMAYLAKLPDGGAVVVDGVLERCTQGQAEEYVKRAQEVWPNWRTSGVESVGKGDDFVQVIKRNPGLRISPQHSGRRSKEVRLEKELSPWFENGTVRISDAETPFLNELRSEFDSYPNHTHDDAMDAVYYALRVMPDVLVMPRGDDELPEAVEAAEKSKENPVWALAKM